MYGAPSTSTRSAVPLRRSSEAVPLRAGSTRRMRKWQRPRPLPLRLKAGGSGAALSLRRPFFARRRWDFTRNFTGPGLLVTA
jgi:hypothetical protein